MAHQSAAGGKVNEDDIRYSPDTHSHALCLSLAGAPTNAIDFNVRIANKCADLLKASGGEGEQGGRPAARVQAASSIGHETSLTSLTMLNAYLNRL